MFTGIIDHSATINNITEQADSRTITIATRFTDLILGESIAVDGICLTVVDFEPGSFKCDISQETLNLTTASQLKEGDTVNLERAMQASDRFGGHIVLGHVDATAHCSSIATIGDYQQIQFQDLPEIAAYYLIPKGSICVNGVSLTINKVLNNGFEVMLIPHTLERTNLQTLKTNDRVNIEFDYLARIIHQQTQITEEQYND